MFCRSLFVLLHYFFWPLCCLLFFDVGILIAPLVSSSSSFNYQLIGQRSTCYSEFQWTWILDLVFGKKSLKISKMFTKAVNGRIDNTMTNKKRTNNNLQSNTQKTKDWATGTPLKLGMNTCAPEEWQFLFH
jgi:hypothetical protein